MRNKKLSKAKKPSMIRFTRLNARFWFVRLKSTFGILDSETNKCVIVQFSMKDPWMVPQIRRNYPHNGKVLAGWMFAYAGVLLFQPDKEEKNES